MRNAVCHWHILLGTGYLSRFYVCPHQALERLLKELARSKPVTEGFLHGPLTAEEQITNTVTQQARLSICRAVDELVSFEVNVWARCSRPVCYVLVLEL